MIDSNKAKTHGRYRRGVYLSIAALVVAIGVIITTIELARETQSSFLLSQKERLLVVEIAVFGIILVETLGRAIMARFRERDAVQMGMTVRAALRAVAYSVIAVVIVSILAATPSLAVGVGAVTGIIVGFSAQNIIGNVIAGTIIATVRPFTVGDEIVVMGITGRVIEMGVVYTRMDAGERLVFVPNIAMMNNAIQRTKGLPDGH